MSNENEVKNWDVWFEANGVVALSITADGKMDNYNKEAFLEFVGSLHQTSVVVDAFDTIARLHDHEKSTHELAQNMYSARCIALQALRVIKGERG